jgi:hypothetical protein
MRWTAVPEDLRRAEEAARTDEILATGDYRRALAEGIRSEIRVAARALEDAQRRVRDAVERIQRDAKREASVFYPQAATLEEIQGELAEGEALVLYGIADDRVLAVVMTAAQARFVRVGTAAAVSQACAAVLGIDSSSEGRRALAAARRAAVDPLGLGDEIRRVLVSPEADLSFLPLGALFGDREVVAIPSASAWLLLRREAPFGKAATHVLALGDPLYAADASTARSVYWHGRPLSALPSSRAEAEAVGDTTLLGGAATEEGLRATLASEPRWRAVHLACHGLIDPERPLLSCLALATGEQSDGFLTALEVFRMDVPADLVVLSACETGRGRIVQGEGIIGLTRAFMHAGAPRVIVSLWKVDDAATQALMARFYERWKSGVSTAAALREAQQFVRAHERWKHPYFWAAWVLWGLGD